MFDYLSLGADIDGTYFAVRASSDNIRQQPRDPTSTQMPLPALLAPPTLRDARHTARRHRLEQH